MAGITSQTPVLVHNLLHLMENKVLNAKYEGYSSCPVMVNYNEVLLTEFKYDGELDETFNWAVDQGKPGWYFMLIKRFVSRHSQKEEEEGRKRIEFRIFSYFFSLTVPSPHHHHPHTIYQVFPVVYFKLLLKGRW